MVWAWQSLDGANQMVYRPLADDKKRPVNTGIPSDKALKPLASNSASDPRRLGAHGLFATLLPINGQCGCLGG